MPRAKQRRTTKSSAPLLKARVAELERERELLSAIANHAPSLICLVDADGRVRPFATNKAFERTLGYQPHETGGELFWERYVPDGARAVARDCILGAVRAGAPTECEGRWLQRDGGEIDVAWTCTPLPKVESGGAWLITGTDITDRKRHEAEVRRSRARIVAAADDARRRLVAGRRGGLGSGRGRRSREGAARARAGNPSVGAQRARSRCGASHRRCAFARSRRARRDGYAARDEHQRRRVLHRDGGADE